MADPHDGQSHQCDIDYPHAWRMGFVSASGPVEQNPLPDRYPHIVGGVFLLDFGSGWFFLTIAIDFVQSGSLQQPFTGSILTVID